MPSESTGRVPLAARPLTEPHPHRLSPEAPGRSAIIAAHAAALASGDPGYTDPHTRLFVFSAVFLADRGCCCDTGCRHCPYLD